MRNKMKYISGLVLYTIILFLLIIPPADAEINDYAKYLQTNVVHRTMDNGINVIMLDHGYASALAMIISFRTGSVDESYDTMGVAHMLEHMLFKGTDIIGTTDFSKEKPILDKIEKIGEKINDLSMKKNNDSELQELKKRLKKLQDEQRKYIVSSPYSRIYAENGGVSFNASTSKDLTTYYIELPASKLELWASLESERLRNPVFREFYLERGAVFEERLMRYESDGQGGLFEQFQANAFIAHPYRHPVIGWKSNIKHFTIRKVRNFYYKNYIPSRMTITIIGKQNPEETFATLKHYFGKIKKRKSPPDITIKEPEQKGERRFEYVFESNPYLLIGWHKPAFPSREDYIFDIISSMLSDGNTSRLYKSLVIDKGIAASVEAYNGYPGSRYDNLFIIAAIPKNPNSPEALEEAIYNEMNKLIEDVSEEELKKVINKMESSYIFDLDTNMGIARLLSYYETNFLSWQYAVDYLKVLKTININDIKDTLKKYLIKNNRTVGILRNSK